MAITPIRNKKRTPIIDHKCIHAHSSPLTNYYKQSLGSNPPTFALLALPSNTNSLTNLPVAGPF
jgi:hypothetical protein